MRHIISHGFLCNALIKLNELNYYRTGEDFMFQLIEVLAVLGPIYDLIGTLRQN